MWVFPINKDFDRFDALGERDNLADVVGGEDLWPGVGATISVPNQTTGVRLSIVSLSAQDVLTTGTGIHTVRVHYLDTNWNEAFEDVDLNGLTPVTTTATDVKFVQRLHSIAVGTGGVAAGKITVSEDGGAGVYSVIPAGGNMCLSIARMVPAGKTLRLTSWSCSSAATQRVTLRLRANTFNDTVYGTDTPIYLFKDTVTLQDSSHHKNFSIPWKIPEKTIVKVTAWGKGTTGAYVSASFEGFLL